jgi:ribosomal protein S6--L-glutamate ligase
MHQGKPLTKYDCVYIRGSFRYANLLQSIAAAVQDESYTPITSQGFTAGHDKIINQIVFSLGDVPIPKTYLFSSVNKAKDFLENHANYPIIIKIPHGTQGKGVLYADSYASASSVLDTLSALRQPFLVQEYIETGSSDIRAIVVGDKVCAAMVRKAKIGEKRSNIHAGGEGEPITLDEATKKVAIDGARAMGASVCAIDILSGAKGPVAIEGNLSPGLQGITKATKIDVPDKIAKYLFEQSKKFMKKRNGAATSQMFKDLGIEHTSEEDKTSIVCSLNGKNGNLILPKEICSKCNFKFDDEFEISAKKNELNIKRVPKE